jgi:hypothetical protein
MIGHLELFWLEINPAIAKIANRARTMSGAEKENLARRLATKIRADYEEALPTLFG